MHGEVPPSKCNSAKSAPEEVSGMKDSLEEKPEWSSWFGRGGVVIGIKRAH